MQATLYNTMMQISKNCTPFCMFVPWTLEEQAQIVQAATGWNVSAYELIKVGQRALTLARIFNLREGLDANDDRLAERSYGPTTSGALADGGIDREELREALDTYYAMIGWDKETGVPGADILSELGIDWADEYLPKK